MKKKQKKQRILSLVILTLLLASAIFISFRYFRENKNTKETSNSGSYKSYVNKVYGFEFLLPDNSEVSYEGNEGVLLKVKYPKEAWSNENIDSKNFTGGTFSIEVKNSSCVKSDWLKETKKITINSNTYTIYEAPDSEKEIDFEQTICLEKNNQSFTMYNTYGPANFGYRNIKNQKAEENGKKFFDEILYSFQFID